MSNERSEAERLALQFLRDQARALSSLQRRNPNSGFELAVQRLFGDNPKPGKRARIGNCELTYSSHTSSLVSFLPARWRSELDRLQNRWRGCENWWAGYPLIVWIEMRAGGDGTTGHLHLNAEVGPIAPPKARKGIVDAIETSASTSGSERIRFPAGAANERQLYSRFLRKNSIEVTRIQSVDEVENRFSELISDFEPEFELITSVIPQLSIFRNA